MRKVLLLMLLNLLVVTAGDATELHAIIIADTLAENIGDSVFTDYRHVREEVQHIAVHTGMDLHELLFVHAEANARNVIKKVNALEVQPDDVILFYFAGHGYRTTATEDSPWPVLSFEIDDNSIDFLALTKILEAKGPRLVVSLADSCNNFIPDRFAPHLVLMARGPGDSALRTETASRNYQKLFLDATGVVMASGAKAGDFAWGSVESGGAFTNAFMQSLELEVSFTDEPRWDVILERTKQMVIDQQEPIYEITDWVEHEFEIAG